VKVRRRRILPATRLPAYGSLLAANFALLMATPFFTSFRSGLLVERLLSGVMLLAAFVATGLSRANAWKLLVVMVPFMLLGLEGEGLSQDAAIAGWTALLIWAEFRILRQFLTEVEVGWDTVAAAAGGFILIAVIWANFYMLLERWRPGSFTIDPAFRTRGFQDVRAALQYFSFVTLTTVGYGEIHPADVGAGGVAVAEALIGQLYLAIMISRMVGLHLAGARETTSRRGGEGS